MDKIILITVLVVALTGWFALQGDNNTNKQTPDNIQVSDDGTIHVDQGTYKVRYSKEITEEDSGPIAHFGEIKIFVNEKETQMMDHFSSRENSFSALGEHQELITNIDINFDGINDLGIITGVGYGGVNYVYNFYTFYPDTNRLEQHPEFFDMANPTFSEDGTVVTTRAKDGPVTCTYNYTHTEAGWQRSLVEEEFVDSENVTVSTAAYCS